MKIHWQFSAPRYRRGCPAVLSPTNVASPTPQAAGLVVSYPRACRVRVSRVDEHGVTRKASGLCERLAG
jgi:hypothetical protein